MSFEQVIADAAVLLVRVREMCGRGEIVWTAVPPPEEAPAGTKSWTGVYGAPVAGFISLVRYEQNGAMTTRAMVADRGSGVSTPIYPPLSDELCANAEAR